METERKRKSSLFWKKVSVYFSEFTNNTSLHGFKYIGDKQRTNFERILWLAAILTSIIICTYLLSNTYMNWVNSPIMLVEDKQGRPISTIPFPAITICPESKINLSVYNFTHANIMWRKHKIMEEELNISLLLCDDIAGQTITATEANDTETVDTKDFIYNISVPSDCFGYCQWGTQPINCQDYLSKAWTEDGVCYTFNGLTGDQIFTDDVLLYRDFWQHNFSTRGWTMYADYNDAKEKNTYPRRMFSSGFSSGFSLLTAINHEYLDYACRNIPEAYKIVIHYPAELPRTEMFTSIAMTSVLIEAGTAVSIALIPQVITTSEALRKYKPKKRGCYYPNERELRYFKAYSQQKCEFECIQNVTGEICGCFAYYMPMINDTPICRSSNLDCIHSVKQEIASRDSGDICNCLPTCSSVTYSAEVSQYSYDLLRRFRAIDVDMSNYSDLQISKVTIFFKESHYFVKTRSELYTVTDFISNCGGLFGLFIGFSIISVLEMIYFVTIRLVVNCRKYGRNKWYGSTRVVEKEDESLKTNAPIAIIT